MSTIPEADWVVTRAELSKWAQVDVANDDDLAAGVLWAVTVLVRKYGHATWTHETIRDHSRLIAILLAKNYYLNPTGNISEAVGPLSERKIDDVVRNMVLTEQEQDILAAEGLETAAEEGEEIPTGFGDLQVLTTTRGPIETGRGRRGRSIWLRDEDGSAIEYVDIANAYAVTPRDPVTGL